MFTAMRKRKKNHKNGLATLHNILSINTCLQLQFVSKNIIILQKKKASVNNATRFFILLDNWCSIEFDENSAIWNVIFSRLMFIYFHWCDFELRATYIKEDVTCTNKMLADLLPRDLITKFSYKFYNAWRKN